MAPSSVTEHFPATTPWCAVLNQLINGSDTDSNSKEFIVVQTTPGATAEWASREKGRKEATLLGGGL